MLPGDRPPCFGGERLTFSRGRQELGAEAVCLRDRAEGLLTPLAVYLPPDVVGRYSRALVDICLVDTDVVGSAAPILLGYGSASRSSSCGSAVRAEPCLSLARCISARAAPLRWILSRRYLFRHVTSTTKFGGRSPASGRSASSFCGCFMSVMSFRSPVVMSRHLDGDGKLRPSARSHLED